jgi:hypothetical protein
MAAADRLLGGPVHADPRSEFEIRLVVVPRHTIHAGGGFTLKRKTPSGAYRH